MIQLKGGFTTEDPRLDRIPSYDERSRAYPITALIPPDRRPRSYTWRVNAYLDQGREGACVGFAWAHELAARPSVLAVNDGDALAFYKEAQRIDEWPGEDYSGTSVLAGAKVMAARGFIKEYRWAFGLDDLILAVGYRGPAVLGVPWYRGMFAPDPHGYLHATGGIVGGHAIIAYSVDVKRKFFRLHNSWGRGWGANATALVTFDTMATLLDQWGEACIPVVRSGR